MPWRVDGTSKPGVLALRLEGLIAEHEMAEFVHAHNAAIEAFGGKDYRVFCDVRDMKPLSQRSADLFEKGKAFSAAQPNFQGSAVLVSSPTIALQHRRTSTSGGVIDTEVISSDERECWAHLAKVRRHR